MLEKPFGSDLASAQALNRALMQLASEDDIYRVDHFLGTSTVLNLIGIRFAYRMLEPVLNAGHVESVEIVYDETLALEGRAGYYDGAGALIDMLQSHLLQVLALVAMEAPATLESRAPARRHGRHDPGARHPAGRRGPDHRSTWSTSRWPARAIGGDVLDRGSG